MPCRHLNNSGAGAVDGSRATQVCSRISRRGEVARIAGGTHRTSFGRSCRDGRQDPQQTISMGRQLRQWQRSSSMGYTRHAEPPTSTPTSESRKNGKDGRGSTRSGLQQHGEPLVKAVSAAGARDIAAQAAQRQKKFTQLGGDIVTLRAARQVQAKEQDQLWKVVKDLQKELAQAERMVGMVTAEDAAKYDSGPSSSLLCLNSPESIANDSIPRAFSPWLQDA
ncbi:unnamed protein product [Prorocentrum cordatum]|uniref:Tubulin-specific chaperone A n=1 Tax=Prorocentrum cordatum TaxID=2364126 RepID=A0ABN9UIS3_9DINO|nr:unnamed protein product [Polarella glacialis]